MKGIVAWFASNGVAANFMAILIVAGGLMMMGQIKKEVFPEMSSDMIEIQVLYPGAAPEEVEEGICIKIEEAVQSLAGVKKITSTAAENMGTLMLELLPGEDAARVLDEVKARVDAIDTFPIEAENPIVNEAILRRQVLNVAISGPADELTLKKLGERVRDEISSIPGITQVQLGNVRPYEVSIEVSEDSLRQYELTFNEVAEACAEVRWTCLEDQSKRGVERFCFARVPRPIKGLNLKTSSFAALPMDRRFTFMTWLLSWMDSRTWITKRVSMENRPCSCRCSVWENRVRSICRT